MCTTCALINPLVPNSIILASVKKILFYAASPHTQLCCGSWSACWSYFEADSSSGKLNFCQISAEVGLQHGHTTKRPIRGQQDPRGWHVGMLLMTGRDKHLFAQVFACYQSEYFIISMLEVFQNKCS